MYYKLKDNILLRGWELLPYAVVKRDTKQVKFLNRKTFDALTLCEGKIDTDLPLISDETRAILKELEKFGVIEACAPGEEIRPDQKHKKYPSRYIRTAHWSITGRCNYRCRHCYMSAPEAKYGELSHEVIMKMIDELAECGVMNVSLTGGEPLVRSDFLEIVDALLERDIHITQIYSNGALVKKELLQALDQRGIHPEFNMSYDAPGLHDWLRGIPGAETAVDNAFLLCREMGFPTGAEMCIHQKNKHLLRETVNHLRDVGCQGLKTNPVGKVGEWKKYGAGLDISLAELFEIYLEYVPHYYEDGMPVPLQLGGFFAASGSHPDAYSVPTAKMKCDPSTLCLCGHARQVMYLSPEGRALPCLALSGMDVQEKFPLVPEIGLAKCLTDSFYMNFIDTRASAFLEANPECQACEYKSYCLGGCRASALETNANDDLLGRDLAACRMFRDGYAKRLVDLMKEIKPEAKCFLAEEEIFR